MTEAIPLGKAPKEVAEELGLSADMLRQLCSNRYFGEFLEGHKSPQGHRRFTEQDLALLKLAVQRQKRGVNYESTKELIRRKGPAGCLAEELGYEGQNVVLETQVKHYKALYEHERDRSVALERVEVRYEKARALGVVIMKDAAFRKEAAREASGRAIAQVEDALVQVRGLRGSVLKRIFGSGDLARAEAKLEEALRSQGESQTMFERLSLLELQAALNLQLPGPKKDHSDAASEAAISREPDEEEAGPSYGGEAGGSGKRRE